MAADEMVNREGREGNKAKAFGLSRPFSSKLAVR